MATVREIAAGLLENSDAAIEAAERVGLYLPAALALWEQENLGRNTYGNDKDGTFSTPGAPDIGVTEENYAKFYDLVVNQGKKSNGVGPLQITYRGFHPQAKKEGLNLWEPVDNGVFGFRLLLSYKKTYGTWELARAAYKNGPAVANRGEITASERAYARRVKEWEERLKGADEEETTMAWHLAPSLKRLQKDLDAEFGAARPNDGTIGDQAHAARTSEHNPDNDADSMPKGAVSAIDIYTEANGKVWIKPAEFTKLLAVFKKDPRVWYVIHKGKIYSRTNNFASKTYTGSNPHNTHIHLSLMQTKAAHDNVSSWKIENVKGSTTTPPPSTGLKPLPVLSLGDRDKVLVPFLKRYFYADPPNQDEVFGRGTRSKVMAFQAKNRLAVDGVVGPKTWAKIVAGGTKLPSGYAAP